MNLKLLKKICATSILFSNLAIAGTEVGNGGDVIVCMNGPVETVEFFDTYEARVLRGWSINLGSQQLSVKEKVDLALSKLEAGNKYSLALTKQLKNFAEDFWQNSLFVPNTELTDVTDTFAITIPNNCKLKQIAIQRFNPSFLDKRYVVNQDLWNKLTLDDQAALVLHEIIYRLAIKNISAKDSVGSRLINSILFSNMISYLNQQDMNRAWQDAGFYSLRLGALELEFSNNQNLFIDNDGYTNGKISSYGQDYENCHETLCQIFDFKNLSITTLQENIHFSKENLSFMNSSYNIYTNQIKMNIINVRYHKNSYIEYFDFNIPSARYLTLEINNSNFCFINERYNDKKTILYKKNHKNELLGYSEIRKNEKICVNEQSELVKVP